jgi:hypothetical protein
VDVRRQGQFGQLVINGTPAGKVISGSVLSIVAETLKTLSEARLRNNADGESEIVIRIRNKAFDGSKDSLAIMNRSDEVADMLGSVATSETPNDGESYDQFVDRLEQEGWPRASALMIAADSFGIEATADAWTTDPKAVRFRELNSHRDAFEAALPSEYDSLKRYVIQTYPDRVEGMTFRTA